MTNGKLTVEATGIPVVCEFTAHPGDTLVIINGVCVGVQRPGGKTRALLTDMREAVSEAPRKRGAGQRGKTRWGRDGDDMVLAVIRKHGPNNAAHILDLLKLDPKDPERRAFQQRITRMRKSGQIQPIKAEQHKGRPRYELGEAATDQS